MPLTVMPFGPLNKGVVDTANPSLDLTGAFRRAVGLTYSGAGRLSTRAGTQVALTLYDDQETPAPVTGVCAVAPFKDRAVAIAHSSVTEKAYLYVLSAGMDDWYDVDGLLQGTASPRPVAVLWGSMATAPDVTMAEGLGTLYVAHAVAANADGLYWPTKTWNGAYPVTVATLKASGAGGSAGSDDAHFLGVIGFQQHLWGWGYGTGSTAAAYRPELARFSQPNFGALQAADSLTVGDRVGSERERIIGAGLAGEALILGASYFVTRVTGFGRASWYKQPVERSNGFAGPKCMVSDGPYCYYWSHRGPMRIAESGPAEPLWDPIADLVSRVVNPEKTVATRDGANDLVIFAVDVGQGVRTRCAYDVRREVWLGPDDDWGLQIRAGGEVDAIRAADAPGLGGPGAPPSTLITTAIGTRTATANWTAGDSQAETQIEYRRQGESTWTVAPALAAPGVRAYALTGLSGSTDYEWRAAHRKNGQMSLYTGPVAGSQFRTSGALTEPTGLYVEYDPHTSRLVASWTNSGEADVETEVYFAGPRTSTPADSDYGLAAVAPSGVASATISIGMSGTYWVKIRHVRSGATHSVYTGPMSVDVDWREPD